MNALKDAVETEAQGTHMPADTPASAILHPRRRVFWLVVVHIVVGWLGADLAYSAGQGPTLYAAVFIGLMFSQTSLLGIYGSLGTSPWWKRVFGVVVGIGYLFSVFQIAANDVSIETLIIVFLTVITVVSLPLLIARFCRIVIRLAESPDVPASPIQFSIRHLIIVTFVVACLITIGRLVQPLLNRGQNNLLAIALTFGIVGILPVWFALASKWPTIVSIGVVAVGACAGHLLGWGDMDEGWYWMTATATEALSVVVTLLLVRSWGYRLVRLPR